MSSQKSHESRELEALFKAARELESTMLRERNQNALLQAQLTESHHRQSSELTRTKEYAQKLLERDEQMRKRIQDDQAKLHAYASQVTQLQLACARLSAEAKEQVRRGELELTAARAAFEHVKRQAQERQEALDRIQPELIRGREELERAQNEVLDREHRYQASLLAYQGRDRNQQEATQAVRDHLKRVQDELVLYKSRWLEAERQRQDSEKRQHAAEQDYRRQLPSIERIKALEEANRALEQALALEKNRRKQADTGAKAENQEKDRLLSALHSAEDRLAYVEAQLSKMTAESALLRAARKEAQLHSEPPAARRTSATRRARPTSEVDFEELERLALPGYPIKGL